MTRFSRFNHFTATAGNIPGLKSHKYKLSNGISNGPVTNLLSILYILIEVLSLVHAKRGEIIGLNGIKFGFFFIGRSLSDGAESMAVEWLIM